MGSGIDLTKKGLVLVNGSNPPSNTSYVWFNNNVNNTFFYDGTNWVSTDLIPMEFGRSGAHNTGIFFLISGVGLTASFGPTRSTNVKLTAFEFSHLSTGTVGEIKIWSNGGVVSTTAFDLAISKSYTIASPPTINKGNNISPNLVFAAGSFSSTLLTLYYRRIYVP